LFLWDLTAWAQAHEASSLKELAGADVSALQGIGPKTAEALHKLHIKTVTGAQWREKSGEKVGFVFQVFPTTTADLAHWKFYQAAKAINTLAALEEADARPAGAKSNIADIVDKEWENKTFKEIADAPVSALQGLAEWVDPVLKPLHIASVADLGNWKHAATASAIVALSAFEN
jgi:hypothetical protein